jgi:hypothetical protein
VLGLEPDYATFGDRRNRDGFEQFLRQILINAIGERCCATCVKVSFCSVDAKDICLVNLSPAPEPAFMEEPGGRMIMYLRIGNTTRPLDIKQAVVYAAEKWGGPALRPLFLRRPALHPGV